jgi:hypothetical protein
MVMLSINKYAVKPGRNSVKKVIVLLMLVMLLCPVAGLAAVRGSAVLYVGGTYSELPENTKGKLDLSGPAGAAFVSKKGRFAIPYAGIESLEYGQKAGRRVGVAVAVSPLALFSKKRKHYCTVSFTDEQGNRQGVVFEVAKGKTHAVMGTLQSRSGKQIEFESEEARKQYGKGTK